MDKKVIAFEQILRGCQKNDVNYKELLYKQFYGYLMGIVLRYVTSSFDGEELVNDSFMKIFANLKNFIIPANNHMQLPIFKGWMAKIASRTAIDHLRKQKQWHTLDEIAEHEHPATTANVTTSLYVTEILALLQQLPELHRLVFNLYEVEGFSHQEIALILNIGESSSRVYLTRAKEKLRLLYLNTLPKNG